MSNEAKITSSNPHPLLCGHVKKKKKKKTQEPQLEPRDHGLWVASKPPHATLARVVRQPLF